MRMVKAMVAAAVLVAFGNVARADDQVVLHRTNPVGTIARDTITGGVLGSAVAGGVILYNMGIENHSNYDWGRTLAWGAGIGLAAGLIWGVVDATTAPSYSAVSPVAMAHDGESLSLDRAPRQAPGQAMFPIALGRF